MSDKALAVGSLPQNRSLPPDGTFLKIIAPTEIIGEANCSLGPWPESRARPMGPCYIGSDGSLIRF